MKEAARARRWYSTCAAQVRNACANMRIQINQDKEKTNICKHIVQSITYALHIEIQQEAIEKAVGEAVEKEQKKQQEAVEKAVEKTVEKTTVNSLLKTARALMETLQLSAEQALKAMKVSDSERAALRPMLQA